MKRILIAWISGTLFFTSCAARHESLNREDQDAVRVANEEATRIGYDISKMNLTVDRENSVWKSYSPTMRADTNLLQRLESRDYLAVYYSPTGQYVMGSDLFVFVDRHTGKVLTILAGQ